MRLMPCMYLIKLVFGRLGSGFLMYKYSAICLSTPIKKLHHKDTVLLLEKFVLKLRSRATAKFILLF